MRTIIYDKHGQVQECSAAHECGDCGYLINCRLPHTKCRICGEDMEPRRDDTCGCVNPDWDEDR